jgi:hypothetical protein
MERCVCDSMARRCIVIFDRCLTLRLSRAGIAISVRRIGGKPVRLIHKAVLKANGDTPFATVKKNSGDKITELALDGR